MSKGQCSVEGCSKPQMAMTWCSKHYSRWRRHGDLDAKRKAPAPKPKCSVDGCSAQSSKKGFCGPHYQRLYTYGRAHTVLETPHGTLSKFIRDHVGYADDACLFWPFKSGTRGYGALQVNGKLTGAHRYMCMLVYGNPPFDGAYAAHSCGNGHHGCVNPRHLRWATAKENASDKELHGTHRKGEHTYNAKLTEDRVRFIRSSNLTGKQLAKMFGCSRQIIDKARRRDTWAHVE